MVAPTAPAVLLRPLGASSSVVRDHSPEPSYVLTYALTEHLGLIPPQNVASRHEGVTSFMHPAPVPNADETNLKEDARVADPLSDEVQNLLNTTARVNREVFTELFRPVPSNLVSNWATYEVSVYTIHIT